ncbi:MAG: histidinol-phosphate aminotransferase family protein [Planctomycetes bacterium]|nr:histidinol-phosphate aminotransferase family protein [Planctomycetota bacterium]
MNVPTPEVQPTPYARAVPDERVDLRLDGNEGPPLTPSLAAELAAAMTDPEDWRCYPDERPLRAAIARRFGLTADRVALGAGADELLDRVCRAWLAPGRALAAPQPCFAMLPRYVRAAGAELRATAWTDGPFDADALLAAAGDAAVLALTTPNNPTGLVIPTANLVAVATARPDTLVLVDLAYVDYADEDPTMALLELPNVVVVRTFSKGRSLAGLRVGYALGDADVIAALRATGSPYPCSAPSLRLCERLLALDDPHERVAFVRVERKRLAIALGSLGLEVSPSQANFVYATAQDRSTVAMLATRLARAGIAVRLFDAEDAAAGRAVRITCPGDDRAFTRLLGALLGGAS